MKLMRPSAKNNTLWNIENIWLDGWWIVHIIVVPCLAKRRRMPTSCWARKASENSFKISFVRIITSLKWRKCAQESYENERISPSPVVGSSQNNSIGFVSSSDANDNLFFSPPDNALPLSVSPIRVLMQFNKLTFANVECTKLYFSCLLIRLSNLRFAWNSIELFDL